MSTDTSTTRRYFKLEEVGDVTVVTLTVAKIIEDVPIREIGQELFSLVEAEGRVKIILNFIRVEFMSSAMFSKLITLERKIKAHGGRLRICHVRAEIYDNFKITKLIRVFDIKDEEEDALADF